MKQTKISQKELQVITLKDINNLSDNKCAKIMGISKSEFRKILSTIRSKIALTICEDDEIMLYKEPTIMEEECKTKCKFRCATCSKIYEIDYTKEEIMCPLCMSKKVMNIEDIGSI